MGNLYKEIGQSPVDNLINDISVSTSEKAVKIKKSTKPLLRGTVLGINTTNGYASPANSTKSDGTELADCILAHDVDSSDGDVFATAYTKGQFNRKALILDAEDTIDKHEARLRTLGIFLKDNI